MGQAPVRPHQASDVIELVEGMVKAGSPVQANRVQALISMIFSFAVDADLMEANPCSRLRKRGAENQRNEGSVRRRNPTVLASGGFAAGHSTGRVGTTAHAADWLPSRGSRRHQSQELSDLDESGQAAWLLPARAIQEWSSALRAPLRSGPDLRSCPRWNLLPMRMSICSPPLSKPAAQSRAMPSRSLCAA